jgi:uncharacterized protein YlxW (UPF0749 family)
MLKSGPLDRMTSWVFFPKMLTNVFFCRVSKSQNENADDFEKRRSQAAIRAQAKKELEKEQQVQQEIKKMKDTYGDKTVELEAPRCVLTLHCPVVSHFL